MPRGDSAAAWRLFEFNWIPLGAMGLTLALSAMVTSFSVRIGGAILSFAFVATYAGFAYYNANAIHRRDPQVVFVLGGTAQIVMVTVLMAPLTYVAAGANFPLQDLNLLALDRALGLDWRAYIDFVNERPLLADWLSYGYTMIKWPIFAIPVILAAAHRYIRLQEFTLAFALALALTTLASIFVPAIGVYYALGLTGAEHANLNPAAYLEQLRDLPRVRDGSLREIDLFTIAGIVTFPSFHAASAALYTWALWPVRWIRPIAILANTVMLAATPINGGHYFVDLAAGIGVAALAVAAARMLSRRIARAAPRPEAASQPSAAAAPAVATD